MSTNIINPFEVFEQTWYVRPAGGSYGTEDGTSYDNAWDGFTNIDWDSIRAGDTLIVAGTHLETLTVEKSGINIRGDHSGDAGIIDSQDTRNEGIIIGNKNNIPITSLTSIDAVLSCLHISGTSTGIITNACTFSGSGNQGIQHLDTASATHNQPICTGNADDGISGHENATIVINGGAGTDISGNDQGVNFINGVVCTINNVTFGVNTTYDLFVINSAGAETPTANVNNCTFASEVNIDRNGILNAVDCTFNGLLKVTHSSTSPLFTGTRCIFESLWLSTNNISTLTNCLVKAWGGSLVGVVIMNKCRIDDNVDIGGSGDVTLTHCLTKDGIDFQWDVQSGGSLRANYCIFDSMNTGDFGVVYRTGSSGNTDNCDFVGASNVGLGMFAQISLTSNNNIYTDLSTGYNNVAGTDVINNSCFFNNSTDITGIVTNNSPQITDPLLLDVPNNDFSLGVGSSCIGTGLDLGTETEGIDTATWGNGVDEVPVVTTKLQTDSAWDIGAYIS